MTKTLTLGCTALAMFAFGSTATAQEATLIPGEPLSRYVEDARAYGGARTLEPVVIIGSRSALMRDEVIAALEEARADGSYDNSGEATFVAQTPWVSDLTRDQVVAEVMRARANGTLDTSGEHWHGSDPFMTQTAVAAVPEQGPIRVAARR